MKWCTPSDYLSDALVQQGPPIATKLSARRNEVQSVPAANVIDIVPLLANAPREPEPAPASGSARPPLIAAMVAVTASGSAAVVGLGMLAAALAALAFLVIAVVLLKTRA